MKKITTLFLLLTAGKFLSQNYVPVPTTGYTLDAIAESTTALSTTGGAIDGSDYVMYSVAYGVQVGSAYGLPNNGLISSGTKTFQLQSYTAPNLLYIPAQLVDSLTFVTPTACFSVSLLGFATEAGASPASMSVTVRFTDNTTQVFPSISVNDWFTNGPTQFYNGFDRVTRLLGTLGNVGAAGNPRMFAHDLALSCANQSKTVKRIIVKNNSSARVCIMAASAVISPFNVTASPVNLCNTGTVTFSASGTPNFTWVPVGTLAASNATVVTDSPTVTTQYTVQGTSSQNCVLNAMITVNVYTTIPTLTVTNSADPAGVCPTTTVNLTASGATTYTWIGANTTVTNGVTFGATVSDDFTVTGTNACGSSTAAASLSVHPLPNLTAVASTPSLCSGSSLTLTAVGNSTGTAWSGGPIPITDGVGFSPTSTITYSVIGTSALSCTALATVPVTVVTTPLLPPTASPTIFCLGNSSTLTASGATSYTWASATQTVFTNPFVVTPTVAGPETFTVTKANANCYDTKIITVVTNSLPGIFAIATPTLICSLSQSTLAAAGGNTYTWTALNFGPVIAQSPVVSPSVSTTYSVAAHDGTCVNTTTVLVATNPIPTISISSATNSICRGSSLTMTASGGLTYTWTSTVNTNTAFTTSITESPTTTAAFTAIGDNAVGCTASAVYIVQVAPTPTLSTPIIKSLVCNGGTSTISVGGSNTFTLWGPNSVSISTSPIIVTSTNAVSGPVIYTVVGTNTITGCQTTKTLQINVFIPALTITGNTNTCYGNNVILQGNGAGSPTTYTWNTGSGSPVVSQVITTSLTAPAVFTLSATGNSASVNGCLGTQTVGVGIYQNPTITAVAQKTTICKNEKVELYGDGGVIYDWSNGAQGSTITVGPLTQIQTISYTLTGTDANGCVNTATVQVKVSGCTGINEFSDASAGLLIYPNPNNGEFTIQAGKDLMLTLSNELGQVIRTIGLSGINNNKVSVSDLAKGIYFISGEGINQKIIVAK